MQRNIQSAPTLVYPESDGKPMAETDIHRDLLMELIWSLQYHFIDDPVYVSGNLLIYYAEGDATKSVALDIFIVHGVEKKATTDISNMGRRENTRFRIRVVK